jgi:hypothetical protein
VEEEERLWVEIRLGNPRLQLNRLRNIGRTSQIENNNESLRTPRRRCLDLLYASLGEPESSLAVAEALLASAISMASTGHWS